MVNTVHRDDATPTRGSVVSASVSASSPGSLSCHDLTGWLRVDYGSYPPTALIMHAHSDKLAGILRLRPLRPRDARSRAILQPVTVRSGDTTAGHFVIDTTQADLLQIRWEPLGSRTKSKIIDCPTGGSTRAAARNCPRRLVGLGYGDGRQRGNPSACDRRILTASRVGFERGLVRRGYAAPRSGVSHGGVVCFCAGGRVLSCRLGVGELRIALGGRLLTCSAGGDASNRSLGRHPRPW
jgi:hypothetical protein